MSSQSNLSHDTYHSIIGVCDCSTGTLDDVIGEELLTRIPSYLSDLRHYYSIYGSACILWIKQSYNGSQTPKRSNVLDLLRLAQQIYVDDDERGNIRPLAKEICYDTDNSDSKLAPKGVCHVAVQTDTGTDDSWKSVEQDYIKRAKTLITAATTTNNLQQAPEALSDSDDTGPEEPAEDLTLSSSTVPATPGLVGHADDNEASGDLTHPANPANPANPPRPIAATAAAAPRDEVQHQNPVASDESTPDSFDNEKLDPEPHIQEGDCRGCQRNEIETVILPCGHYLLCVECAATVQRCPSCDEVIQASIRAYRA